MLLLDPRDRVQRLRLRAGGEGARLRLAEALARLGDLHPSGLSPDAVLLIRRLDVDWGAEQDAGARAGAVRRRVAEAVARAARPALGPVPPDADVVLFASRAELLACLALDGLARRDGWWWPLLGAAFVPARFVDVWTTEPEFVPGALAWLAERGESRTVLRQLHVREARRLLDALVLRFGLTALQAPLIVLPDVATADSPPAPWHEWAPELRGPALAPPVALLAATARGLAGAGALARSESFVQGAARWAAALAEAAASRPSLDSQGRAEVATPPSPRSSQASSSAAFGRVEPPAFAAESPDRPAAASFDPTDAPPNRTPVGSPTASPRAELDHSANPASAAASEHSPVASLPSSSPPSVAPVRAPVASASASPPVEPLERRSPLDAQHEPVSPVRPGPFAPVPTPANGPSAEPPRIAPASPAAVAIELGLPIAPVATALGGSFYLINVALALDLYGDFSRPADPGCDVSPWDFLAEMTARLLDAPAPVDRLWGVLAALAGRPRVVPTDGDPRLGAPAEFAPPWYERPPELRQARFAELERRVRDRLARAIDLPPATWLMQQADIRLREARLDVHFALADHPLEVRIAGLDRDPGWLPAAGRDIRFWYHA